MNNIAIVWFRQDLRINNNPALSSALNKHHCVIPIYILETNNTSQWKPGGASRYWLHHSLKSLDDSLHQRASRLIIRSGKDSLMVLQALIEQTKATYIYWNRLYEPQYVLRDSNIKQALRKQGIEVNSFNGALLNEPWEVTKKDGGPFRVFTPFWKAAVKSKLVNSQWQAPDQFPPVAQCIFSQKLESLDLLPTISWDAAFSDHWQPGEAGAHQCLDHFLENAVVNYSQDRNRPNLKGTSLLSPHLHFGEISPQQIVEKTNHAVNIAPTQAMASNSQDFIREIGWREFANHLLYHFPETVEKPLYERFEHFPWEKNYSHNLKAWQAGETGIPLVDAGMRELWETGWMHNRVRMIVASMLTKNMLIPWQEGAKWFWDTLVDADLAHNTLGWQWAAGCGADAAPFFRIFNPVTQAQKFDPSGQYIRQWIPEIARLPDKYLAQPWMAPANILKAHGLTMDKDYPNPVLDLKTSRERALNRYNTIRKSAIK